MLTRKRWRSPWRCAAVQRCGSYSDGQLRQRIRHAIWIRQPRRPNCFKLSRLSFSVSRSPFNSSVFVQQQMLQQVQMQRRESTLAIRRRNAERTRKERAARIASRTMSRRTENLVRGLDESGFTPQTQFASLIPTAVGVVSE